MLDLHCVITFFLLCLMHSCSYAWVLTVGTTHTHTLPHTYCKDALYKPMHMNHCSLFDCWIPLFFHHRHLSLCPHWKTFHVHDHTTSHILYAHTNRCCLPSFETIKINIIKSVEREALSGPNITSPVYSLITPA